MKYCYHPKVNYVPATACVKYFIPLLFQKKTANGKRKASFENQDYGSAKQRKLNTQTDTKNEDQEASKFPSKLKASPKKGQGVHKGHDEPFIKTSSLFRNNPEIPDVFRSVTHHL